MGTHHCWGEEGFDWKGLDEAINLIAKGFRRWRLSVHQVKEKYGTARIYMGGLGFGQVHDILYPGYCFSQFPTWLWRLDCKVGKYLVGWMNWFVVPLQEKVYRYYYKKAVERYPHLRDEILVMADWSKLIEGIGGYKHDDHWVSSDSPKWNLQHAQQIFDSRLDNKMSWKNTAIAMKAEIDKALEKV